MIHLFLLRSWFQGLREVKLPLKKLENFVDESTHHISRDEPRLDHVRTYITGTLISSTALHSFQFSGTMEKRPCRNGV